MDVPRLTLAISAMLMSFASDGLSNITASIVGQNSFASQVGMVGMIALGYVWLQLETSRLKPKPKPKRKPKRKPRAPVA